MDERYRHGTDNALGAPMVHDNKEGLWLMPQPCAQRLNEQAAALGSARLALEAIAGMRVEGRDDSQRAEILALCMTVAKTELTK